MNVLEKKGVFRNSTLKQTMHRRGKGLAGVIINAKDVTFCGTCGKEF